MAAQIMTAPSALPVPAIPGRADMTAAAPDAAVDFGALVMAQEDMNAPPAPLEATLVQAVATGDAPEGAVWPDALPGPVATLPPPLTEEAEAPGIPALPTRVDAKPVGPKPLPAVAGQGQVDEPSSPTPQAPMPEQAQPPAPQAERLIVESSVEKKTSPDTPADKDEVHNSEALDNDAMPQQAMALQYPLPAPPPAIQPTSLSQVAEPKQTQASEGFRKGIAAASAKPVIAQGMSRPMPAPDARERQAGETATDGPLAPAHDKSALIAPPALPEQGAAAKLEGGDSGLPSPLLSQTIAPAAIKPAGSPYPPAAPMAPQAPVVQAQPGRIGADIGVQIAKAVKGEREDLLIRLDPREMGRIDVRLSFDRDGLLRAVLSADSPTALDMLRRESSDLNRALTDAGVRADGQSLRFDTRSGGGGHANHGGQRAQPMPGHDPGSRDEGIGDFADAAYRPLRASGHVDLMA